MFRIMIVDDERIILNGIRMMIEEELELSFPIDIAMAANVPQAIELMNCFDPDLILTDIRMPIMDGFELIQHVREKDSYKHIVILTSHADFEYAQRAIRFNVADFILKPIDQKALKDTITQAYMKKKDKEGALLRSSAMELCNMMLYDLSTQELTTDSELIGQLFPYTFYTVIVLHMPRIEDSYPEILEKILLQYYNACHCFRQRDRNQIIAICNHNQFLVKPINLEREFLQESQCEPFEVGISISATSYKALHSLYVNAVQKIFYTRHFGAGSSLTEISLLTYQDCVRIFMENDKILATQLLQEYLIKTEAFTEQENVTDVIYRSFFYNIQLYLENNNIPIPKDLTDIPGTVKDEQGLVTEIISRLIQLKKSIRKNYDHYGSDMLIKKLLGYIGQHYQEDISLTDIADYVGLHPNYICTVFTKSIGQSYLTCIHMERLRVAKKLLLETDFSIERIAGEVGYNSASQFTRVFRKYEAVSPSAYRNACEG